MHDQHELVLPSCHPLNYGIVLHSQLDCYTCANYRTSGMRLMTGTVTLSIYTRIERSHKSFAVVPTQLNREGQGPGLSNRSFCSTQKLGPT